MNTQGFGGFDAWQGPAPLLGFFLIPGPRELVLVVVVGLALYGKVGSRLLMSTRYGRVVAPWLRLARASFGPKTNPVPAHGRTRANPYPPTANADTQPPAPRRRLRRGRLFWVIALATAAALAAWYATRIAIHSAATLPR